MAYPVVGKPRTSHFLQLWTRQYARHNRLLFPITWVWVCLLPIGPLGAQNHLHALLTPSDTLNRSRIWTVSAGGALGYGAAMYGLNKLWYTDYPREKFHTFNDWGEWEHIDKAGHALTAYAESQFASTIFRWTGLSPQASAWLGAGTGLLFQSTIEVFDGFSGGWGFSWGDMAFNTGGSSLFLGQQLLWKEQRIRLKISHTPPPYGAQPIRATSGISRPFDQTVEELYGHFPASFFKDYNGMTTWATVNPASFFSQKPAWVPAWLNLAVGYGANNVFGAYGNAITDAEGNVFYLQDLPRYRQLYLSFDIDLTRLPVKNPLLRTLFATLNWIKIPSPTMEWNSLGQPAFHWMYW
ncbi:MAG: DUF2279 domain-containing protein [Haliscomenobacter sp.]